MWVLKNLCVDLDGTLINTDMLWESLIYQIRRNPLIIFMTFFWLIRGKSYLKKKLAYRFDFDPNYLPRNESIINLIKSKKKQGYKVYLVSASYESIVKKIYDTFSNELFDGYYATQDGKENLSSNSKSLFLNYTFGNKKYDYVGNSFADIPVWNECNKAYIYAEKKCANKYVKLLNNTNFEIISSCDYSKKYSINLILKQIRVHQWVKNVLIFCPAFAVHSLLPFNKYIDLLMAFVSFCFLTSSVYVINDLLDLWDDRAHDKKKFRPLASGDISIPKGIVLALICVSLSSLVALSLSLKFYLFVFIYFVVNLMYSVKLKNVVALDCVLLACMYTYRIFLGCAASELDYSLWLFSFAVFLFLSLAWIKRYIELYNLQKKGKRSVNGRAYSIADISIVSSMYVSFGTLSILVFAMYLSSEEVKNSFSSIWYAYSSLLFILYWMIYIFIKTSRGEIDDDPVLFVIRDKVSLFLGSSFVLLFCLGSVL